jgi:hypothetical protein
VLRRNVQHQMPEEFRRVSVRVEELEKVNRQLAARVKELESSGSSVGEAGGLQGSVVRISELTVEKKLLEERLAKLRAEKDADEKRSVKRALYNPKRAL